MDPLTQASLGAAAAALLCRRDSVRRAVLVGALAGSAPDLDVLIRSESDPLLALEYHRHFTHALLFAPIIGILLAGLLKALFFWKHWAFRELALFASVGALTHGLLDACTSYGTSLYLPFSTHRESWDIISIIDPIFTLPLFFATVWAFAWRQTRSVKWVFACCMLYLCFGVLQRERAQAYAMQLAEARGHERITQLTARPSFGNTVLWRLVYRYEDRFFVDAVQLMPFRSPKHYPGAAVAIFTVDERKAEVGDGTVLANDVERFRFFSQNYLYRYPEKPTVVGDLRYAMFPNSIEPLWGIQVKSDDNNQHASIVYFRDPARRNLNRLWQMISGQAISD